MEEGVECLDLSFNEEEDFVVFELTLVGKLICTKVINATAITAVLHSMWDLGPNVTIKSLGKNMVSCLFTKIEDWKRIQSVGPWSVKGFIMNLKQWEPSLSLDEVDFSCSKFWVQIHNLPPNRVNSENLRKIGRLFGKNCAIEEGQTQPEVNRFVRIRADLNVQKALKLGCFITRENGEQLWKAFKYERLADFCYRCGCISHTKPACEVRMHNSTEDRENHTRYGPWMQASHLSPYRHRMPKNGKSKDTPKPETNKENQPHTKRTDSDDGRNKKWDALHSSRDFMSDLDKSSQWLKSPFRDISNIGISSNFSLLSTTGCLQLEGKSKERTDPLSSVVETVMGQSQSVVHHSGPRLFKVSPTQSPNLLFSQTLAVEPIAVQTRQACEQPIVHQIRPTCHNKRRAFDSNPGEKRQKLPSDETMQLELTHMQLNCSPNAPAFSRNVLRNTDHPISEEAVVVMEARVNFVRKRFLHVKREARQRGRQMELADEATAPLLQRSIVITELAKEAGHKLPPTAQ